MVVAFRRTENIMMQIFGILKEKVDQSADWWSGAGGGKRPVVSWSTVGLPPLKPERRLAINFDNAITCSGLDLTTAAEFRMKIRWPGEFH